MKTKHWILLSAHLILIAFILINGNLLLKDIILIYLVIMVPSFFLSNIEYLFRRKHTYSKFMKNKLFANGIVVLILFAPIIYLTTPRYIPKEVVVKDLSFMINTLENVHPNIYHAISKESFSIALDSTINQLPDQVSELEFFKICARLTSKFQTGHTKPMENVVAGMQHVLRSAFPYRTKIINDRIYVTENLSILDEIPVGSEIIEINGKNMNQLITEWSKLVSYENEVFRNHQITNPFRIAIWNDFKACDITYIEYGNSRTLKKTVRGSIFSNMYSLLKRSREKPRKLFFEEWTPQIGYIGFFDCHDLENYKPFFQSTFQKLKDKETNNLIIDIRGNGGGYNVIGVELMQYIFHQSHNYVDSTINRVSKELIATGKIKRKLGDGEHEVGKNYTRTPGLRQLRENPYRFQGNTYLLIDNATFSAGQGFASAYKCYGDGTIIGEETGGVTVNFGDIHFFHLPNTNMKIMTSWEQAFSACGIDNQRGVIPDHIISNSIEDDIQGKDRVMEFTLDLINNYWHPTKSRSQINYAN